MVNWLVFAILSMLAYGLWGFFPKLTVGLINSKEFVIYEAIGVILISSVILLFLGKPSFNIRGVTFAMLTGILGIIGTLLFVTALAKGKASVIVTITAMYPMIVIFLASVFLKEPITLKQGIGIVFALAALVLFSV